MHVLSLYLPPSVRLSAVEEMHYTQYFLCALNKSELFCSPFTGQTHLLGTDTAVAKSHDLLGDVSTGN